jgi:hypothetical protein
MREAKVTDPSGSGTLPKCTIFRITGYNNWSTCMKTINSKLLLHKEKAPQ